LSGRRKRIEHWPLEKLIPYARNPRTPSDAQVARIAAPDDYFADGLTEDIVTNLSRFRDLRVIAAGSTLQFKGRSINVPEFCRQMRAAYVFQGSVRRAAGRIRITVQLIDGVSYVQLNAQTSVTVLLETRR
jgi:TolB-like protein